VPSTLAPASTGYGIQLIDSDGTFQYSPQCGVANSASVSGSGTTSGAFSTLTLSTGANYTGPVASPTTFAVATGNTSIAVLTGTASMTVPATLQSTVVVTPSAGSTSYFSAAPTAAQATATGAAGVVNAGLGLAGVVGFVAAMVL
jgi:hypothetical protein